MSAKATAVFEGDDSKLAQTFKHIGHQLEETKEHFHKLGEIGETVLAALAAEAIFEKIKQGFEGVRGALEMGEKFDILSQNTGVAVSDLVILAQAFRSAGKDGEDVGAVLAKMQKAIVTGSANDMLEKLGVNLEELRKSTTREQFESIGKAINKIENPAERAAAAIAIFGKTGATLLSLFAGEGLEKAAGHVGAQAAILGEDAALFREVAEELNLAGLKIQGFFVGVADKVAPVLKPLLDRFAAQDFSGIGQEVGDAIAELDAAFGDGHLGELLKANFDYAAAAADNYILGQLASVPVIIGGDLMTAAADFIDVLLSGMVKVVKMIPGVKVGVTQDIIDSVRAYSSDIKSRDLEGETMKAVHPYNLDDFAQARAAIIDRTLAAAQAKRAAALAEIPTSTGTNGDLSALSDPKYVSPNVSALTRVGGNFGNGSGDPLLAENRRQTALLQAIRDAVMKSPPLPATGGDSEALVYA